MPVVTKPIPETSANVPETSTAKRPLKEAAPEAIKKQKTSEVEHVKKPTTNDEVKKIAGEDAKKMLFQRLFSEADEIALLQGLIDFTSTKGDPYEDIDAFCIYVKKLIEFDATKNQIVTKLQRLKKKFNNAAKNARKKGQTEDEVEYAKESEKKRFDLSIMIWGSNGVLVAGKSSKKKVAPKEMKPEETDAKVVNEGLSIGREMVPFGSSCGLDESKLTTGWENVEDGAEKREVEEKWKKFKDKQFELLYQRSVLMNKTEAMMFKAES
ncbi:putative transcription factor GeBP family [Arabidopsis thaliana]